MESASTLPDERAGSTRPINWELIREHYDEMIKYATALRLGTAQPGDILRGFIRNNLQHPTYQALDELRRAVKTIFLCHYLNDEGLRREVQDIVRPHEGLSSRYEPASWQTQYWWPSG